jgi:hypothetical protein
VLARFVAAAALLLLPLRARAAGVELRVHYSAIERMLAEQVFTQDGRKYVRGTPAAKCSFAYLEQPFVTGIGGRLHVRARFSGRSARNFFGRCVGLGDSFEVALTATPYYQEGFLRLREVKVESPGRDGLYIRKVRQAMAESIPKSFLYDVRSEAKRILESTGNKDAYPKELLAFHVPAMQVSNDALVVSLEFTLAVK